MSWHHSAKALGASIGSYGPKDSSDHCSAIRSTVWHSLGHAKRQRPGGRETMLAYFPCRVQRDSQRELQWGWPSERCQCGHCMVVRKGEVSTLCIFPGGNSIETRTLGTWQWASSPLPPPLLELSDHEQDTHSLFCSQFAPLVVEQPIYFPTDILVDQCEVHQWCAVVAFSKAMFSLSHPNCLDFLLKKERKD